MIDFEDRCNAAWADVLNTQRVNEYLAHPYEAPFEIAKEHNLPHDYISAMFTIKHRMNRGENLNVYSWKEIERMYVTVSAMKYRR